MGWLRNLAGHVVTTAARCRCCDLPVEWCGFARERAAIVAELAERRRLLARPGVFAADYPGVCSSCGEPFAERTPITGGGAWNEWRSLLCCEVAR